jgi:hypothetical protein
VERDHRRGEQRLVFDGVGECVMVKGVAVAHGVETESLRGGRSREGIAQDVAVAGAGVVFVETIRNPVSLGVRSTRRLPPSNEALYQELT